MTETSSLSVQNLRHQYGSQVVLKEVQFSLRPGEITGYLGANGAGKSTTIQIMTGLLKPTGGTVQICGIDLAVDPMAAKRHFGYVPENASVYNSLTPHEYLSLISELYHLDPKVASERISQLLKLLDLTKAADRPMDGFSKGMRQKVAIVAALIHDPDVIFLDEPLNGLDVNAVLAIRSLLEELAKRGKTIFFSSHILDVVERLCSRVIILHQGVIVADGPPAQLLKDRKAGSLESVFRELIAGTSESDWSNWRDAFFHETKGAKL